MTQRRTKNTSGRAPNQPNGGRRGRRNGQRHGVSVVGLASTFMLIAAACATGPSGQTTQAIGASAARQDDGASLEEKVDTDGDGEMSDEEIETYARTVLLDFSNCMRDNGYPDFTDLVLEDFTEGSGGQGRFLALMAERGVSISDANAIPTLQSCGEGLSDLQTFAPQPSDAELQEREEAVLEFAQCMRDGGLADWPDPDFAANPGANGYGPELLEQFDVQSDEIQDAIAACQAEDSSVALGAADDEGDTADTEPDSSDDSGDGSEDDQGDGTTDGTADVERSAVSPVIEGDTSDLNVAEVTRRDLVQTTSLDGTLGFGDLRPFPTNTTGIVTSLPAEGDTIEFGDVLFTIDNEPVLLFEGSIPQYRPFMSNMSDGPDVEQLERNLVDFGYAEDFDLTVDDDFTAVTRDVIESMQLDFGVDDDGRLDLGRVVFSPTPIRVGAVNVEIGQSISPQINVLSITESDQQITLDLDAEDRSLVSLGDTVDIELPDGETVAGLVSNVAATATQTVNPQTGAPGDATIGVTVVFLGVAPDDVFDSSPVDIIVTESVSEGVLTVPVPALVARSGGGHAVELIVDGGTQLVAVELGDFVDDLVEVTGVNEGDRVVMATAG